MIEESVKIWKAEEYTYPLGCGFIPTLISYTHEDEIARPCVLVVPGGGYCVVSPTEGFVVAKSFYEEGFNVFVLTYTTNLLMMEPLKLQPLQDLSRAVRLIRKEADKYRINPNQLAVCGFSAGGHLSGSLCVHFEDIKDSDSEYDAISNRPNASILSYPVITSGEYAHKGSFEALYGKEAEEEDLAYMSLEKQVKESTPPCFLWQTETDETVPVENSYLFAKACRNAGVPYALHIFSEGQHGLSIANESWLEEDFGYPYTLEQTFQLIEKIKTGELGIPNEIGDQISEQLGLSGTSKGMRDAGEKERLCSILQEVGSWFDMANRWLRKEFNI